MEYDKKALWQRYSEVATADLIELQRSRRLPAADTATVDEMLEFRGVSKTVRENLKNSSTVAPTTLVAEQALRFDSVHKDIVLPPRLIILIALLAVWGFVSNTMSAFDAKTPESSLTFLLTAILMLCLAYGLWQLKPWARSVIIYYSGLTIFISWFFVLWTHMHPDDSSPLLLQTLAHSGPNLSGMVNAAYPGTLLMISACIVSVICGLLIAYFSKPDIRLLFLKKM